MYSLAHFPPPLKIFPESTSERLVEFSRVHMFMMSFYRTNKIIPYYRKLTLHEIKVLEINAT